jgi:hypothetical protein
MRIVVASAYVPFRHDRNARLVRELTETLRGRGHEAAAVLLPYQPVDADPVEQSLGFRMLDLAECGGTPTDRLIALGEPAHALRHPHKTLWDIGSCRGRPEGMGRSDALYRGEARKVYPAIHRADRSWDTRVLYPPVAWAEELEVADSEPYFFWAGSMYADSRPELMLEAMRFVKTGCGLVMMPEGLTRHGAGPLLRRIEQWDLGARVELVFDASPAQRRDRLRRSLGCVSVGFDQVAPEDAVIEAFYARVPVFTVWDSGAPAGIIQNGINGLSLEPNPRLLAVAMNRVAGEPSYRRELGEAAYQLIERLGISWDYVAERLLA